MGGDNSRDQRDMGKVIERYYLRPMGNHSVLTPVNCRF